MPILAARSTVARGVGFGRILTTGGDEGAMIPLQVITVGNPVSDITFTNIPSTYKHLQIRTFVRSNRSDQNGDFFQMTFNSDSASNYSWHFMSGTSTTSAVADDTDAFMELNRFPGSLVGEFTYGLQICDILDYANTNKYKTMRYLGGWNGNTIGEAYFGGGTWRSTSAITTIKLNNTGSRTFNQYSRIALYGIKGA